MFEISRVYALSCALMLLSWSTVALGQVNAEPAELEFVKNAEQLLLDRKYAELEKIAVELRKKDDHFPSGGARLGRFYDGLCGRHSANRDLSIEDRVLQVEAWNDAKPTITSRVTYSASLIMFAWYVRGGGLAITVSPEKFRKMERAVSKIDQLLTLAEKDLRKEKSKDAFLYRTWMDAGVLEGYETGRMKKLLYRSMECDPWYAPSMRIMGQYSLPRWHGSEGDLLKLAKEITSKYRAEIGEGAYAVLADFALDQGELRDFHSKGFEWSRIREGLEAWVKKFPEASTYPARLALAAHRELDKPAAITAIDQLKGRWNKEVFDVEQDFLRTERWACEDAAPGDQVKVFEAGPYRVVDVAYVDGGKSVLAARNWHQLDLCSVATGERIKQVQCNFGSVRHLQSDPSGRYVVFSCFGYEDSKIGIFDLETGEQAELGNQQGATQSLAVSNDMKLVVAGDSGGRLRTWRNEPKPVPVEWTTGHQAEVNSMSFSPDGAKLFSSVGAQMMVWDPTTREKKAAWDNGYRQVWASAWSPKGDIVASAGESNVLKLWSPDGKKLGDLYGGNTSIHSLAFSPDGTKLVAATMSASRPNLRGEIVVWNVETKKIISILTGHRLGIWKVAISPDGKQIASASEDGTLRLWPMP